jgi:hypothetical protein
METTHDVCGAIEDHGHTYNFIRLIILFNEAFKCGDQTTLFRIL